MNPFWICSRKINLQNVASKYSLHAKVGHHIVLRISLGVYSKRLQNVLETVRKYDITFCVRFTLLKLYLDLHDRIFTTRNRSAMAFWHSGCYSTTHVILVYKWGAVHLTLRCQNCISRVAAPCELLLRVNKIVGTVFQFVDLDILPVTCVCTNPLNSFITTLPFVESAN